MQVRTMLHHLMVMAMERECSLAFPNNSSKHLSYNWDICTYQKKKKKQLGYLLLRPFSSLQNLQLYFFLFFFLSIIQVPLRGFWSVHLLFQNI